MTTLKTFMLSTVAIVGLTAPLAAQSVGGDVAGNAGAGVSAGAGGVSAGADMSADAGANASTGTARTGADSDTSANPTLDTDVASTADATAEGDTLLTGNQAQAGAPIGLDVASSAGETIGEIDDVVSINGETMAVIGVGGFLGIGEHDVALPVTELMVDGNTILAMGYTREQLESMAEYNAEVATKLDSEQMVSLGKS